MPGEGEGEGVRGKKEGGGGEERIGKEREGRVEEWRKRDREEKKGYRCEREEGRRREDEWVTDDIQWIWKHTILLLTSASLVSSPSVTFTAKAHIETDITTSLLTTRLTLSGHFTQTLGNSFAVREEQQLIVCTKKN